jgi:hypothetical protein
MMNMTETVRREYIQAHVQYFGYIETPALVDLFQITKTQARNDISKLKQTLGIEFSCRDRAWIGTPVSDVSARKAAFRVLSTVQKAIDG